MTIKLRNTKEFDINEFDWALSNINKHGEIEDNAIAYALKEIMLTCDNGNGWSKGDIARQIQRIIDAVKQ